MIKLDCKESTVSIFPYFFLQTYFYESIVKIDIQVIVIIEVKNCAVIASFLIRL